jgi:hypothetical protein
MAPSISRAAQTIKQNMGASYAAVDVLPSDADVLNALLANATSSLSTSLQQFIALHLHEVHSVYISRVNLTSWLRNRFTSDELKRVKTCADFGCANEDANTQTMIDLLVSSEAGNFEGNMWSTFTICVCGLRNDQVCRDVFGRENMEGRLLV